MNATTAIPTDPREGERMQRVALRFWHAGAAGRRRTDRPRWRRGVARNVGRRLLIDAPLYNSAKHGLSSIANASVWSGMAAIHPYHHGFSPTAYSRAGSCSLWCTSRHSQVCSSRSRCSGRQAWVQCSPIRLCRNTIHSQRRHRHYAARRQRDRHRSHRNSAVWLRPDRQARPRCRRVWRSATVQPSPWP